MMKSKKLFVSLGLMVVLILSVSTILPVTYSQDQAACPSFTIQTIEETKQEFYADLQKIISDATPATSNTALAFDLYRDYLTSLTDIFQDDAQNINESGNVLTPASTIACQQIISKDKSIVQQTLQNILKASISGKQSFNLTEKYAQINQKFTDLNQESNQVSKKIKDFSQQLPCYSQACVQD